MPFGYPDYKDMQDVAKDCLGQWEELSNFEKGFLQSIEPLIAMERYITKKQLKVLYVIYYTKVDSDPDALVDFIDKYRLHNLS